MKQSELARLDHDICGTVWTSPHAKSLMDTLCNDIGPRTTGSKGFAEATRIIGNALKKLGATNVKTEPVKVLAWKDGPVSVELKAPKRRRYEAVQHTLCTGGKVSGPLVDIGGGSVEALDRVGKRLEGAIALMQGHTVAVGAYVPVAVRARRVSDRGAAGLIVRNTKPDVGPTVENVGVLDNLPIPSVGVSFEDGYELADYAAQPRSKVQIEVGGRSRRTACTNLIADIKAGCKTDEMVVMSAHLDAVSETVSGAFDDLTGVVTAIEIVRALAPFRKKFRRNLRLLFTTSEELGWIGSRSYVERHADELDNVSFNFNLDCMLPTTAKGVAVMWAPKMRDLIERYSRQTQCEMDARNLFCMSSDYMPFMLAGIAASRPADWHNTFPVWSHTAMDTINRVPIDWIRANAMAHAQWFMRVMTEPKPLPTKRKSPEEVAQLLAKENVEEAFTFYGLWDF